MKATTLRGIRPQVRAALLLLDLIIFTISVYLATKIGDIAGTPLRALLILAVVLYVASVVADARGETARTFDQSDVVRMLGGATLGTLVAWIFEAIPSPLDHASGRLVLIAALLGFLFRMILRIAVVIARRAHYSRRSNAQRTLVVGAGRAAISLVRVIRENRNLDYRVVGCVDDQIVKRRVEDVRVLGKIEDLPAIVEREQIACVIVAIPSVTLAFTKRIAELCSRASGMGGRPPLVKAYPGVSDVLDGAVQVSRLRDIKLEDLLSRDAVAPNLSAVAPFVRDEVILVTGAGGSIGSELCRQIATLRPRLLLLMGHGENSLFAIEQELRDKHKFTNTKIILADVANAIAVRQVFSEHRPHIVFHAAAHKHVPIVETNVCEAVRNNVFGTHNVALAAAASRAAKFVLLSTDKAVNPTSVMGTTKRVGELVCQSFGNRTGTEFVAVRFGNVLGSRGSVLPTFRRQLEDGGPLTITHRDMERYFMTIPEAVTLVLEATAIGRDGHVYVLDMGKPVKILHLAETVIRLAGLAPYRDIPIVETGIRPGEKLFEELLTAQEDLSHTSHERLFVARQERIDYADVADGIAQLKETVRKADTAATIALLTKIVPSFAPGRDDALPVLAPADGPATPRAFRFAPPSPGVALAAPLPSRTRG